jgi:hypothetical protein
MIGRAEIDKFKHNDIVVSVIPNLIDLGSPSPWPVLPPGIHDATLLEIEARFATTPHRRALFDGFGRVISALEIAGCAAVYLDGSFVSGKPHPDDFDGCWELAGVDPARLDPVLLRFENKREAQKLKFQGEMFIAEFPGAPGVAFLDFFQVEKFSGRPKGIVRVRLPAAKGAAL